MRCDGNEAVRHDVQDANSNMEFCSHVPAHRLLFDIHSVFTTVSVTVYEWAQPFALYIRHCCVGIGKPT